MPAIFLLRLMWWASAAGAFRLRLPYWSKREIWLNLPAAEMAAGIMCLRLKRSVAWLAIYAVALHVILLGLTPIAANGSTAVDPYSVICHSVALANAVGDSAPVKGGIVPGHACEHCNLCGAMAAPAAPDAAVIGTMAPVRVLHVLRPVSSAAHASLATTPKLARGPPAFA